MEVRLTYTLSRTSHFDPSCICTPHPLPWRVVTQPLSSDSIQSPPEIMLWHLHVVYSSQKWHAGHKLWWGKAVSQQSAVTGQLVNPARKRFFFFFFLQNRTKPEKCVIFIAGERCWICTHKGSTGLWNELGRTDFPIWWSFTISRISSHLSSCSRDVELFFFSQLILYYLR